MTVECIQNALLGKMDRCLDGNGSDLNEELEYLYWNTDVTFVGVSRIKNFMIENIFKAFADFKIIVADFADVRVIDEAGFEFLSFVIECCRKLSILFSCQNVLKPVDEQFQSRHLAISSFSDIEVKYMKGMRVCYIRIPYDGSYYGTYTSLKESTTNNPVDIRSLEQYSNLNVPGQYTNLNTPEFENIDVQSNIFDTFDDGVTFNTEA